MREIKKRGEEVSNDCKVLSNELPDKFCPFEANNMNTG